eukprot:4828139-Prymnesium_polylepis.1
MITGEGPYVLRPWTGATGGRRTGGGPGAGGGAASGAQMPRCEMQMEILVQDAQLPCAEPR